MKKQILFLMMALFASVTVAWGQNAQHVSNPDATSCVSDALHPVAGKPYAYQADVNPIGGTFTWWATKDPTFINGAGIATSLATRLTTTTQLLSTSGNYAAATVGAPGSIVTITWSDAVLSTTRYRATPSATPTIASPSPTFIAVHYTGAPVVGACADNIKVFELDPINQFTVDVKNLNAAWASQAYAATVSSCSADVASATYTAGNMVFNYGVNYLYYEVVAANFSAEWKPTFAVTAKGATQSVTIEWTDQNLTTTPPTGSTTWYSATTSVTTTAVDTSNGVSIFVRLTVQNNNYENNATLHASGTNITLAVDGQNSVGIWDVVNSLTACTQTINADQNDLATHVLLPRPAIPFPAPTTISTQPTNQRYINGNETN